MKRKTTLTKVPGLGSKGAAQIILDLTGKIDRVKMYSDSRIVYKTKNKTNQIQLEMVASEEQVYRESEVTKISLTSHDIMNDALMACKELGFKEDKIIPIAQRILSSNHSECISSFNR